MKARKGSPSNLKKIALVAVQISVWLVIFGGLGLNAQITRLYNTTRGTGIVQELNLVTGAVVATNVGGITNGRGMDFSPYGGLFVANGLNISSIASTGAAAVPVISYIGETPHDLCFDATGNLYVVTNLNVYVYNPSLSQTLAFAHALATTTGDGNTEKGWGIEIRPDNGEIYVIGAAGLKRFSSLTGIQIGATIPGSAFGFAGIKFTTSAFGGVYLYVGNVISGVDQIRAYDVSLTFLRSFFAAHVGNPIDLEVNPANGDLYLFNTVVSLPANRFLSNETAAGGFSTLANPTRGSALGSFEAILAQNDLRLEVQAERDKNRLHWVIENGVAVKEFSIRRSSALVSVTELGRMDAAHNLRGYDFCDDAPIAGKQTYEVIAFNADGENIASSSASIYSEVQAISIDAFHNHVEVVSHEPHSAILKVKMVDIHGAVVHSSESTGYTANLDCAHIPSGLYIVHAECFDGHGKSCASETLKVVIAH